MNLCNRCHLDRIEADAKEDSMPIRLLSMTTNRGVLPVSGVKLGVGRAGDFAADPQQRAEGVEGVEAPVKAEGELVQVGLQVLGADAVMAAREPCLEVAENEVDDACLSA
jgi:hypothetical protein